ncbi:hypothetical protein [Nigerium massiliense]|uniref:hypothetical protein n=1 Tax=Nigerium massiliense TaxID=1522317 RepID=UPI00058FBC5C|nr:hypothetical protein [Nigerium massiliense]
MDTMIVDCGRCEVRGAACSDCVISVLLGVPGESGAPELTGEEQRVLQLFAGTGMLPPLRHVRAQ